MRVFTLAHIQEMRANLTKKCATLVVEHAGIKYPCLVVPASMCPDLPNFGVRITPTTEEIIAADDPSTVTLFGVSDGVPEMFRPYWLLHEIMEFVHVGIECKGRCASTTLAEIKLVTDAFEISVLLQYLRLRKTFFTDLLVYADKHPTEFTSDDIREFTESLLTFSQVLDGK